MTTAVQDHIHLSDTVDSTGEKAPTHSWVVTDREETVVFNAEIAVSLTGVPYAHVTKRSGLPVIRYDYAYNVKIAGATADIVFALEATLNALAGKELFLVDHYHCNNSQDHTAFIKHVFLSKVGPYKRDMIALAFFYIPIYLNGLDY